MQTPSKKLLRLRHVFLLIGLLLSGEQIYSTIDLYQRNLNMIETMRRDEAAQHLIVFRTLLNPKHSRDRQAAVDQLLRDRWHLGVRFLYAQLHGANLFVQGGERVTPVDILDDPSKRERVFTFEDRSVWIVPRERKRGPPHGRRPPRGRRPPPGKRPPHARHRPPGKRSPHHEERPHAHKGMGPSVDDLRIRPPTNLVEFIPVKANALQTRTQRRLAFGLLGALVLLLGTLAMWRLLLQRERTLVELERKRTLAALGKMSAVISHELISPLSGALGHAELLTMTLEEGRPKDKAHVIVEDLERLNLTMRGLLDFLNSGRIERAMHSPDRLLDDATSLFRDPRLTIERSGLPERWSFDLLALGRVLSNVVKNALQISQGPVHVCASMTRDGLCLEVRDHGPGFPQDFDPFSPFATQREGGTGLGLAICLEIVEAHRGSIAAQNHPDGGALVTILIPHA